MPRQALLCITALPDTYYVLITFQEHSRSINHFFDVFLQTKIHFFLLISVNSCLKPGNWHLQQDFQNVKVILFTVLKWNTGVYTAPCNTLLEKKLDLSCLQYMLEKFYFSSKSLVISSIRSGPFCSIVL